MKGQNTCHLRKCPKEVKTHWRKLTGLWGYTFNSSEAIMWQKEQTLDSYQVANQKQVSVNMKISLVLVFP